MEYICKKCGDRNEGRTEIKGNQIGLYCTNCGSWIKWLPKDEYARRGEKQQKITYYCVELRRNCEYADKLGDCSVGLNGGLCKNAEKQSMPKEVIKELPNELTINGVVYVKKGV